MQTRQETAVGILSALLTMMATGYSLRFLAKVISRRGAEKRRAASKPFFGWITFFAAQSERRLA